MTQVVVAQKLQSFLAPFKRVTKDKDGKELKDERTVTHTWLGNYTATYHIPKERYSDLYKLVADQVFLDKAQVHLIERFTNPSILKVDLDFEFEHDTIERRYSLSNIKDIIKIYNRILFENMEIDTDNITCYLFERDKGYREKGKYKDGIHLMWPDISLNIETQKFVRHKFLQSCMSIFKSMNLKNKDLDEIVDESIIDRNGWMMYGSCKVSRDPYLITHIFNYHMEEQPLPPNNVDTVEYLSIYNQNKTVYQLKSDRINQLEQFSRRPTTRAAGGEGGAGGGAGGGGTLKSKFSVGTRRLKSSSNCDEDLDTVKKLVGLLTNLRANDHKHWIEVGLCLFNIDDSLLETWIEFSKRIPDKFVQGECEEKWITFQHRADKETLGIGSLHRWAMLDDPVGYETVKRGSLSDWIEQSMNGTTYTISKVVHEMYKYQYVCSSIRHNTWHEFKNHRWHEIEAGIGLKNRLSNDVLNEYLKMNQLYLSRATEMEGSKKHPYIDNAKKLLEVTLKLQDITFKDKIMKECTYLFYKDKFVESLDIKANLICFENGVYDLDTKEFRDGRPEDYCSLSTQCDYVELDLDNSPEVAEIKNFMKQVFPIVSVCEYVYLLLSSFLIGKNPNEKFHVWTGTGGKSYNYASAEIQTLCKSLHVRRHNQIQGKSHQSI
jgi:hypothetical protein